MKGLNKWIFFASLLLVLILAGFFYIDSILNSKTIYSGISVDGIEVGGLTQQEALYLLEENMEKIIPDDAILLKTPAKEYRLPFDDISYGPQYEKALEEAFQKGREGSALQRLREIWKIQRRGLQISSEMCYNEVKTTKILESIRKEIETKSVSAKIRFNGGKLEVTPHKTGLLMDLKLSLERIDKSLIQREWTDVDLCIVETLPNVTTQMLEQIQYKLGQFSTVFSTVNEGRVHNIKTACSKIHEKLLLPGQDFSMDRMLGDRTEENGYQQAKIIINNELVDGLGGGICQVTSTMYNSVLLAGLEVLERRNHTLPLTYIDVGRDATISQGYIDFRFKNNTGYAVLIEAKVVGNQVIIAVWGRKPEQKFTYKIRTKILEKIEAEGIEEEYDATLLPGETRVIREAVPGFRVEVFRDTIDAAGKVVHTEKLSTDRYQPQKKKIKVGPPAGAIQ